MDIRQTKDIPLTFIQLQIANKDDVCFLVECLPGFGPFILAALWVPDGRVLPDEEKFIVFLTNKKKEKKTLFLLYSKNCVVYLLLDNNKQKKVRQIALVCLFVFYLSFWTFIFCGMEVFRYYIINDVETYF